MIPLSLSALYFDIHASTSPQKARAGGKRKAEKRTSGVLEMFLFHALLPRLPVALSRARCAQLPAMYLSSTY